MVSEFGLYDCEGGQGGCVGTIPMAFGFLEVHGGGSGDLFHVWQH